MGRPPRVREGVALADARSRFLASRAHLALNTRLNYERVTGRFVLHAGEESPVRTVTTRDVQGWVDSLDVKPVTKANYVRHLRAFFRYCMSLNLIDLDPTDGVGLERVPETFPKALRPEQVERSRCMLRPTAATASRGRARGRPRSSGSGPRRRSGGTSSSTSGGTTWTSRRATSPSRARTLHVEVGGRAARPALGPGGGCSPSSASRAAVCDRAGAGGGSRGGRPGDVQQDGQAVRRRGRGPATHAPRAPALVHHVARRAGRTRPDGPAVRRPRVDRRRRCCTPTSLRTCTPPRSGGRWTLARRCRGVAEMSLYDRGRPSRLEFTPGRRGARPTASCTGGSCGAGASPIAGPPGSRPASSVAGPAAPSTRTRRPASRTARSAGPRPP